MPPSAKKYFILHGTAFFTHAILAVACVGAAIRYQQRHKRIGCPEEREENSGNFAPDSNRFAFSLVNSIAGRGGHSPYNPIYFYGRPGADLAGFLRMIEARFSEAGDKRQILYAKCSELAKIDGSALRSTVLIVDDVQNLTDDSELQVHLMKCLTELCRTDNQVILAGTCQADQISNLADGIMEQFETALIAGIQQE